jgi:hypothetical protein
MMMAAAGRPTGQAYRYFKLNISDNNGHAQTTVGELKIFAGATDYPVETMTSNVLPSPLVASASAEYSNDKAWKAFDNDIVGDYWRMVASSGWLKIDLGAGNDIVPTEYKITGLDSSNPTLNPKDWTFEGSVDDVSWDVLSTETRTSWGHRVEFTYAVTPV